MPNKENLKKRILIIEDRPTFSTPLKKRLLIEFGDAVLVDTADSLENAENCLKNSSYFLGIIDLALNSENESKYFFPQSTTDFEGIVISEKYKHKFEHYCFLAGTVQKIATEALGHVYQAKVFSKSNPPSFGVKTFPQNILDYIRSLMSVQRNDQ